MTFTGEASSALLALQSLLIDQAGASWRLDMQSHSQATWSGGYLHPANFQRRPWSATGKAAELIRPWSGSLPCDVVQRKCGLVLWLEVDKTPVAIGVERQVVCRLESTAP